MIRGENDERVASGAGVENRTEHRRHRIVDGGDFTGVWLRRQIVW